MRSRRATGSTGRPDNGSAVTRSAPASRRPTSRDTSGPTGCAVPATAAWCFRAVVFAQADLLRVQPRQGTDLTPAFPDNVQAAVSCATGVVPSLDRANERRRQVLHAVADVPRPVGAWAPRPYDVSPAPSSRASGGPTIDGTATSTSERSARTASTRVLARRVHARRTRTEGSRPKRGKLLSRAGRR